MRCERCENEADRVTKLRGESQFICRRCRAEDERQGKKLRVVVPREYL